MSLRGGVQTSVLPWSFFFVFSLSVASSVECGLHETMVAGSVASSSAVVAS